MPVTYNNIGSYTMPSAAASYTFSNIPQTYTDLILVIKGGVASAAGSLFVRFNGDSGNNYSSTVMSGDGSAMSYRCINGQSGLVISGDTVGVGTNTLTTTHFMGYSNQGTYHKLGMSRSDNYNGNVSSFISKWSNTAAITSIQVYSVNAATIDANVSMNLYGIRKAD
jgi:hypothetical protein